MAFQERPAKRQREDNSGDATPERSDIWFEDGNIVLSANGKMLFCVHRGVLSAKSPIFRDMFALSQPDAQETFDGKPLLVLFDSADDVTYLLRALYDWSECFPADRPWSMQAVVSILCMGTKYEIASLRREAIKRLYGCFPTTLGEFDFPNAQKLINERGSSAVVFRLTHCAFSYGIESIIPALFLSSTPLSIDDLMDSYDNTDPSVTRLSSTNIRRMLRASQHLIAWQNLNLPECFAVGDDDCDDPDNDPLAGATAAKDMIGPDPSISTAFVLPSDKVPWCDVICGWCHDMSMNEYDFCRIKLWRKLPEMLGLPSWDVLKAERLGVLGPANI